MANDRRVVYAFDADASKLAATIKQLKTDAKALASAVDSVNKAVRGESRASRQAGKVADQAKLLKAQTALYAQQVKQQQLALKAQQVALRQVSIVEKEHATVRSKALSAQARYQADQQRMAKQHQSALNQQIKHERDIARQRAELVKQFPNRLPRVPQPPQRTAHRQPVQGGANGRSRDEMASDRLASLMGGSPLSRSYIAEQKAAERAANSSIREEKRRNTVIERERKRHYDWLSRQANRSLNALQVAPKRIIDMTAALLFFQTFRGIQTAITDSITSIIDFNEQIENSRLGMASTTTAAGQFVDQFGKALPIAEQVNIALREADSLIPKLLKVSAERGLNFEGMLSASTATAGFTRAAGFNEQQRIDVVTGIVALSQKLNISQGQIVKTIDNVIKGVRVQNTELGSTLGITSKQVKNWREQGTLAENLLRVLQGTLETSKRQIDESTRLSDALRASWGNFALTAGKPIFDLFKDIKRESLEFLNGLNGDDAKLEPLREAISAIATDMGKWVKSVRELAEGTDYNAIKGHIEGIYKAAGTLTEDMIYGGLIAAVTTGHPYLGIAISGALSSKGFSIGGVFSGKAHDSGEASAAATRAWQERKVQAYYGKEKLDYLLAQGEDAGVFMSAHIERAERNLLGKMTNMSGGVSVVDYGPTQSDLPASEIAAYTQRGYRFEATPDEPDEAELRRQASAVNKAKRDRQRAANRALALRTRTARSDLRRIGDTFSRSEEMARIAIEKSENRLAIAQADAELLAARGASEPSLMRYQGVVNQKEIEVLLTRKKQARKLLQANDARVLSTAQIFGRDLQPQMYVDAENEMLDAAQERKNIEQEIRTINSELLATQKNQTAELERQKRAQFDIADEVMGMISALRDGRNIGDIASGFFRTQTDQMLNNFLRDGFAGGFGNLFGGGKAGSSTGSFPPGGGGGGGSGGAGGGMSLQGIMTLGAGALSAGFGLAGGIKRSQNTMYASGSKRDAMAIGGLLDSLGLGFLGKIGGNNRGSGMAGTAIAGGIAGGAIAGAQIGGMTGPVGAAIGAAIGLAVGGIISLAVKKPSTNKLINKSLKKVYKELGLAYTGDFSNADTGAFPELRSMAGASAVQFGINLKGETIKPGRGAVNAGNISNKILNDAISLRLGLEDTRERVRKVNQALGGDFDSQAARLVAQRANRQRAMRTLPQEGSVSSFWGRMAVQLERRRAGIGSGMSAGEIDAQFTSQLAGVVDSFIDLPESVDRTRIALTALSDDGTVSLTRLKNVAEDVVAVIGGGLPGAVAALSKGDSLLSARDVMTQAYNDAMVQRASQAIQDSALTSSAFQDSVALGTKSIEALARGDFAGAERLAIESRRAMDTASLETLKNLAPGTGTLRILGGNYGGGGLQLPSFGTDTMTVVPGGIGDPLLSITHGGETVRNPAHEDKLQSGVEDLKSIMTDVRDLLVSMNRRGGEAGSIMPQVIRAEVSVAEISDAQRAARTRQSSGSNNANGNIGLPM